MSTPTTTRSDVRLAEAIAALSLATDLGTGQPMQHSLRACLLALRLGEALGLEPAALREVYYVTLLQRVGCTANTLALSEWFDDDLAAHARTYTLDFARPLEVVVDLAQHAGAGRPPLRRAQTVAGALAGGRAALGALFQAACEVAERLCDRLAFPPPVQAAVGQVFERWDGRGWPAGARGEAIALSIRLARLAADVQVLARLGGEPGAVAAIRRRAGKIYDPALADLFCRQAPEWLNACAVPSPWESVLAAEPGGSPRLDERGLEVALETMAHFADLKSPHFSGHSTGVAALAAAAGASAGLTAGEIVTVRRAGLVHDLGRVSVAAGVWDRPGPLSDEEWEQVRLHPYVTERILTRPAALATIGGLAALHHERLDGSGYPRGVGGAALARAARLLAAADVYQAMTEPRAYRPARSPAETAEVLRREASEGRLDAEAVAAVLSAAGHATVRRPARPAGLSEREVVVLRLLARGRSTREIAERLGISRHTAGHHIRHIYDKIGVATRAGATLFAMQRDLLGPLDEEAEAEKYRDRAMRHLGARPTVGDRSRVAATDHGRHAMSEANKALARRYFAEVLHGNLSVIDEVMAPDVAFHGPNYWGEPIVGREGLRGFMQALRAAFPDLTFTVHDEVADGDRVATRFTFTGTHRGDWMGIPATGRRIDLPGADVFRIARGRIEEIRVFYDTLGLMQQLGLAQAPEPVGAPA